MSVENLLAPGRVRTAADLPAAFSAMPPAWRQVLSGWTAEAEGEVVRRVRDISDDRTIAPPDPFRALRLVAPDAVKVVIFGQDPYPTAGHADGLAFSAGMGHPHSLRRIFQVLAADQPGFVPPPVWKLDAWARQGVLLLNPALTVEVGLAGSHLDAGWQRLTGDIVRVLFERPEPPAVMLWGRKARDFFDQAAPHARQRTGLRLYEDRHPSNDYRREFMAKGSHFVQTADLVDWWALGN